MFKPIYHVSPDGGEGLLAVLLRKGDNEFVPEGFKTSIVPDGQVHFLTPPDAQMQLGVMFRPEGYEVARHTHLQLPRKICGTSEVLWVQSGCIEVTIYSSSKELVSVETLIEGDVILLLHGGHSIRFLVASKVLEVKQGPYLYGNDKEGF